MVPDYEPIKNDIDKMKRRREFNFPAGCFVLPIFGDDRPFFNHLNAFQLLRHQFQNEATKIRTASGSNWARCTAKLIDGLAIVFFFN